METKSLTPTLLHYNSSCRSVAHGLTKIWMDDSQVVHTIFFRPGATDPATSTACAS